MQKKVANFSKSDKSSSSFKGVLSSRSLQKTISPKGQLIGYKPNKPAIQDSELDFFANAKFPSNLSTESLQAIQSVKAQKIKEYKKSLLSCSKVSGFSTSKQSPINKTNKEKAQIFNDNSYKKTQNILSKKSEEEKLRLKKSFSLKLENFKYNVGKLKEKQEQEKINKIKIEATKQLIAKTEKSGIIKELIINNIGNLYNDKISIIKESVAEEKSKRKHISSDKSLPRKSIRK